ncbi:MAG: hypothetical protein HYV60_18125, partial [Planctomycetia bacterium]|nr:hypothetical protein [Planctomycetia bacterium]
MWQFRNQNIPFSISGVNNLVNNFFVQGAIDFDDSLSSLKVEAPPAGRKLTLRNNGFSTRPTSATLDVIEIEGFATVQMHGKTIPVQMAGFRVRGNGFATNFTSDKNFSPIFLTQEPFVVEGIKLEDSRAVITIPRTGLNSTSEFQWRSGRLNYKINDVSTTASAALPMTVRGGQLFLSDQSQPTLEFGSVTIAGIQFADGALKASWRQSDRQWVFAGSGSYFGTPVTVGGDPTTPQIIQERGVFKLINFTPPPLENVQVNGILFHLKKLAKNVVGDKITFTGRQEIFVGGAKKYIAAKNLFIINGTASFKFQASTGPVNISVRLGTSGGDDGLFIANGRVESVTASISADFKLFGLDIAVQDLGVIYTPADRTYGVFGKLKVSSPPTGGTRVLDNVAVELGSGPSSPGLLIKDGEVELLDVALSGTITLGSLQATPENLRLKYTRSSNELALTGGVTVNIASKFTAKAAFPGDGLLIDLKTGKVQIKGLELRVGDIKVGPFQVKDLGFVYEEDDDGNTTVTGGGMLTLPAGLEIEAEFTLKNNRLSAVTFGVTRVPGIPVGQPPVLFLTGLKGELKNLDDLENFEVKATITATIGPAVRMFGERHAIAELEGSILVNKDKLELEGNVKLVGGLLGRGQGKVQIFFQGTELLRVDASINLFPGDIMRGSLSFSVDRDANVTFRGNLGVFVPDGIPAVGGKSVGTLEVYMQVRPKLSADESFARFKATVLEVIEFGAMIDFTGYFSGYVNPPVFSRKEFGFYLPGAREFLIPLNDETDSTLFVDNSVALPTMQIHSVMTDEGTPSATVTFSGTSELPSDTIVELYVDSEPDGYQGHLLTSLPFQPGQQTYKWQDLAAYAPVPYDPNRSLYVYGTIRDGNNFPVYTLYSAPLIPPNFNPTIKTPAKQQFHANQAVVFSNRNGNAFTISDPMSEMMPESNVSVTLDAGGGRLSLQPDNANPWHNRAKPLDTNADGHISTIDVLVVINLLNEPMILTAGRLPALRPTFANVPFYDVDGDGSVSPTDALVVINVLIGGPEPVDPTMDTSGVEIEGDGTDQITLTGTAAKINALLDGITYDPGENRFFDDGVSVSVGRFPSFYFTEVEAAVDLEAMPLSIGSSDGADLMTAHYLQGAEAGTLLDQVEIHSMASGRLTGATITIDNFVLGKDILSLPIDDQLDLGIEAHFDAHHGVLRLSNMRSVEQYEAALHLTEFHSVGEGTRTLTVRVGDDIGNQANAQLRLVITKANQSPVIAIGMAQVFHPSLEHVAVAPQIVVNEPDGDMITQATVAFSEASFVVNQDQLFYTQAAGSVISGRF